MTKEARPEGEYFTRLYLERGPPTQDSVAFRNRLVGYLENRHSDSFRLIASLAKRELGLIVPSWAGTMGTYYDLPKFFETESIPNVLSVVTLIYRILTGTFADEWCEFVARSMREENLGYSMDSHGGVHFLVDEEFERNRISALRAADGARYNGVRKAFAEAHSHLDSQPPDTKASVRSMFEALEILARLMEPGSQRLNRQLVLDKLKVSATWLNADAIEVKALEKVFDGFADWVDAMHMYRHGQAVQEPVAPSIEFAVYALSSGAAMLRLLLGVDRVTAS